MPIVSSSAVGGFRIRGESCAPVRAEKERYVLNQKRRVVEYTRARNLTALLWTIGPVAFEQAHSHLVFFLYPAVVTHWPTFSCTLSDLRSRFQNIGPDDSR